VGGKKERTMSQQKFKLHFKFVMKLKMFFVRLYSRKSQLGGQLRIEIETRTPLENEQENPQDDPLNWRC